MVVCRQQYAASGQQPQLAEFLTSVSILQSLKGFLLGLLGLGPGFTDNATVNILPVPGDVHRGIAMTEDIPGIMVRSSHALPWSVQSLLSDALRHFHDGKLPRSCWGDALGHSHDRKFAWWG